jgi:RNA recognition motif-containing protein
MRANSSANTKAQRNLAILADYEHDRNSIFVGNIPENFNEDNLRGLFEHYGNILSVSIIRSASSIQRAFLSLPTCLFLANEAADGQAYVYGFVEYDNPISVNNAITAKVSIASLVC